MREVIVSWCALIRAKAGCWHTMLCSNWLKHSSFIYCFAHPSKISKNNKKFNSLSPDIYYRAYTSSFQLDYAVDLPWAPLDFGHGVRPSMFTWTLLVIFSWSPANLGLAAIWASRIWSQVFLDSQVYCLVSSTELPLLMLKMAPSSCVVLYTDGQFKCQMNHSETVSQIRKIYMPSSAFC